ncbi:MAG: heavy-metal-associated domain-containing protein [Selenomonadaceae bacterium]|nr:heavy-metal-associated domain-containing protein [Selenomonadaceae bacterium]
MTATVVLGVLIALALANGLRVIYRAFFKSEAACCDSGGSSCNSCPAHKSEMQRAMENSYRARVEKIEKFSIRRTIDVDGMTCEHCVANVVRALEKVDGVQVAAASLEKQTALAGLSKDIPDEILRDAINKAGYRAGVITV